MAVDCTIRFSSHSPQDTRTFYMRSSPRTKPQDVGSCLENIIKVLCNPTCCFRGLEFNRFVVAVFFLVVFFLNPDLGLRFAVAVVDLELEDDLVALLVLEELVRVDFDVLDRNEAFGRFDLDPRPEESFRINKE